MFRNIFILTILICSSLSVFTQKSEEYSYYKKLYPDEDKVKRVFNEIFIEELQWNL